MADYDFSMGIRVVLWILILAGFGFLFYSALSGNMENISNFLSKYVFFGDENLPSELEATTKTGIIGALVTIAMVWIIIFVGFSDVLENFSAFSRGIGTLIAFAVAVIAANVGIINMFVITLVSWFAWFGTAALFIAAATAFIAFVLIHLGIGGIFNWVANRQKMIRAASGKTKAKAGFRTLAEIGEESERAGR